MKPEFLPSFFFYKLLLYEMGIDIIRHPVVFENINNQTVMSSLDLRHHEHIWNII